MTDDGQGFAYAAGYAEATKNAQKKIDALVAALRELDKWSEQVANSAAASTAGVYISDDRRQIEYARLTEARIKSSAALKAATG